MTQINTNTITETLTEPFTQVQDPTLRLYAIIRNDIKMNPGKIASQAGHAYIGAIFQCKNSSIISEYHNEFPEHPGTKICLKGNLAQIYRAKFEAERDGIPCFLVVDSGCPNFYNGQPIVTALGLGPSTKDQIQHITKHFKLL